MYIHIYIARVCSRQVNALLFSVVRLAVKLVIKLARVCSRQVNVYILCMYVCMYIYSTGMLASGKHFTFLSNKASSKPSVRTVSTHNLAMSHADTSQREG